jgi:aspartate ammonia-lyase
VTILSPIFGYQKTVEIAQHALSENKSIKAAAIESGLLSNEEADELLNPMNLTDPVKCSKLLNHYTRLKSAQAAKPEKG